jgi:hypothetical protein
MNMVQIIFYRGELMLLRGFALGVIVFEKQGYYQI